jgi:hypothetical protein
MPKMRTLALRAAAALAIGLSPVAASAACTQADMAGTWYAYIYGVDSGVASWARCKLRADANGDIRDIPCSTSAGVQLELTNATVTLRVGAECAYSARFKIDGVVYAVRHITLSRDKITAEGAGFVEDRAIIISLTKL